MSRIQRSPTSMAGFWTDAPRSVETTYAALPPTSNYSAYGPQRLSSPYVRRRNLREGMSDWVTMGDASDLFPNPSEPTATLRGKWVGGSVTLRTGEWGYNGAYIDPKTGARVATASHTFTISAINGPDGGATVLVTPFPVTDAFPDGINNFPLRDISQTGVWAKAGIIARAATAIGVAPMLLGGLGLALIGALIWESRRTSPKLLASARLAKQRVDERGW